MFLGRVVLACAQKTKHAPDNCDNCTNQNKHLNWIGTALPIASGLSPSPPAPARKSSVSRSRARHIQTLHQTQALQPDPPKQLQNAPGFSKGTSLQSTLIQPLPFSSAREAKRRKGSEIASRAGLAENAGWSLQSAQPNHSVSSAREAKPRTL